MASPVEKRNQLNDRRYGSYMNDVQGYLGKVARGRSIKGVDPDQEAFSPGAETMRQATTVDRANAYDRLMKRNTKFK